jgi:hypothetical protein
MISKRNGEVPYASRMGLSMKTGEIVECPVRWCETCLKKVFENLISQFLYHNDKASVINRAK